MNNHMHKYKFDTTESGHHKHTLSGYTDYMLGINNFHIHYYFGISSYLGHTHYYSGITGLPVKTENGHVHKMEGMVETNTLHEHKYSNQTHEDTAYIQNGLSGEAFV